MDASDEASRPRALSVCPSYRANPASEPDVTQTRTEDASNWFGLHHLLAAGTIVIAVHDEQVACYNTISSDAWHAPPTREPRSRPEDSLFISLAFLTHHLFLRAMCRLGASGQNLFIRVYLMPHDLPGVHGQLHCRTDPVVKEARRHLRSVLPLIRQDRASWDANESFSLWPRFFLPQAIDNRTMAEIYSDLPSPAVSCAPHSGSPLYLDIVGGRPIWGLRTKLYAYQRHSVAAMMEKEMNCRPVSDPLYITVADMSGEKYSLHPSTMTILRDCPLLTGTRGGILCEELGTGKTIMILALVLATIGQLPEPEESLVDTRPVLTPLAYRHFPSPECSAARARAGAALNVPRDSRRVPSLTELLLHHIRVSNDVLDPREHEDELEASNLWRLLQSNTPFYHHYNVPVATKMVRLSRSRTAPDIGPRVMYLTAATLIVVPLPLLGQWDREVLKHCYSSVRCLVVRQSTSLPDARSLASEYDLVIISDIRFRKESTRNRTLELHMLKPCACSSFEGSRVPNCRCSGDPQVSPFLQIRWKRFVIDEGHVSGNVAASINHFVRELSIERKWIVTGTPTSNILGLSLGRTIEEREDMDIVDYDEPQSARDLSPLLQGSSASDSAQCSECEGSNIRVWGQHDGLNLRKLGTMISDFLTVPQFHTEPRTFRLHVSMPLCDRRGPRPGAITVLSQVMQMVMVRHRIEDVEKDIILPPMRHDTVYMDLGQYALKSYNAMQASIAINAIDSERRGQDYLFHPTRAKELQIAIDNLSQGMFWSASDILYNVDEICKHADGHRARAIKRQVPQEDLDLLEQALSHAAVAAQDELWRAIQRHEDVPFEVSGFDPALFEAWTRGHLSMSTRAMDLMHPNRLRELRDIVHRQPLITKDKLLEYGNTLNEEENEQMERKCAEKHDAVTHVDQVKKMVKEVQGEIQVLKKKADYVHGNHEDHESVERTTPTQPLTYSPGANLLVYSPLSGVRVGPSLSTKLNYIISEVLQHSPQEKFLIFSKSPLTLAHVAEGLSLFRIKYLRYTSDVQPILREQCIMTFESSDTFRVFLMELKLGARGLNLVSASRVIFCEPVWHPDVESQAIKRAHRIGQTRRITVKTLVIRSTAEEAMVARRQYLKTSNKIPKMTSDSRMRQFIEYPQFLNAVPCDLPPHIILCLDDPARDEHNNVPTQRDDVNVGLASGLDTDDGPTHKKLKMTRFVDDRI
ncbi:P-loop containing nucleoside triphosphate hydrolase protein [Phlebopus sp. FC_14]|nr:P-loop containing nucleoside triphosphate hydrolase protein [Phlebopus sp. FC_14]